jgi:hypothetical protein
LKWNHLAKPDGPVNPINWLEQIYFSRWHSGVGENLSIKYLFLNLGLTIATPNGFPLAFWRAGQSLN